MPYCSLHPAPRVVPKLEGASRRQFGGDAAMVTAGGADNRRDHPQHHDADERSWDVTGMRCARSASVLALRRVHES
jgi:hypothetical protein